MSFLLESLKGISGNYVSVASNIHSRFLNVIVNSPIMKIVLFWQALAPSVIIACHLKISK